MKAYSSSGHRTRKSIHLPSFPTVLLRRTLFLRKHHPMDFPPFCLALRSLSSSLLYWLYCDVRSDPAAHLVLSPNPNPDFLNVFLSKLTSQPLPLLSDQCDDPKKDCSILVPILHFSGFRFRLCRVFIRPVHSMICDLILQNIRSCDSSLLITYSIAENIQL